MEKGLEVGYEDGLGTKRQLLNYNQVQIYQNQVVGVVSKSEGSRKEVLHKLLYGLQTPSAYWVRGIQELQDNVIRGDKDVISKLKEQDAKMDDDFAEGLLAIVGILDNRQIRELTPFERKKVQMISAFATGANVLVMGDLYEGVSEEEKKEIDQILIEFSVCKTILLTASGKENITDICDKIVEVDES